MAIAGMNLTQKKALVWGTIVVGFTVVGKVVDSKNFGTFEGAVAGIVVGGIVTAYMDDTSLPATGTSQG